MKKGTKKAETIERTEGATPRSCKYRVQAYWERRGSGGQAWGDEREEEKNAKHGDLVIGNWSFVLCSCSPYGRR